MSINLVFLYVSTNAGSLDNDHFCSNSKMITSLSFVI